MLCLLGLQLATGDFDDKWGPSEASMTCNDDPSLFSRAVQIAAGLQHTVALIAHKGRVKPYAAGASLPALVCMVGHH